MKYLYSNIIIFFCMLCCSAISSAQLIIKGTIYSEGLVRTTVKVQGLVNTEQVYLEAAKKIQNSELTYYQTNYEIPWKVDKGVDHVIKFTDGLVEKIIYINGVIPEDIFPRQKYIINIDLLDTVNSDMTLIVFWSMKSNSFKALPLSELKTIRKEAHPSFYWNDGSLLEEDNIKESEY